MSVVANERINLRQLIQGNSPLAKIKIKIDININNNEKILETHSSMYTRIYTKNCTGDV